MMSSKSKESQIHCDERRRRWPPSRKAAGHGGEKAKVEALIRAAQDVAQDDGLDEAAAGLEAAQLAAVPPHPHVPRVRAHVQQVPRCRQRVDVAVLLDERAEEPGLVLARLRPAAAANSMQGFLTNWDLLRFEKTAGDMGIPKILRQPNRERRCSWKGELEVGYRKLTKCSMG